MSSIGELLGGLAGEPLVFSAIVFLTVFAVALTVGRHWLLSTPKVPGRPPSAADLASRPRGTALLNGRVLEGSGTREEAQPLQPRTGIPDPFLGAKRVMRKIFRVFAAVIIAALLGLTFVTYRESTPGTGDVLVPIVLATATLITFLHLLTIDRRMNPDPDPVLKAQLQQAVQADFASKLDAALSGAVPVKWEVASPEVHRLDQQGLELARSMAGEGKSMDEICRAIESQYAGWSPAHQQAFRNVMQAALDHS